MKIRKQKLRETKTRYQLVMTFGKLKDIPVQTCYEDHDEFSSVYDSYLKHCGKEGKHVALIGTSRIIGIYWDGVCIRQTIINSFSN